MLCKLCNNLFEKQHFNQKYCSVGCKWKSKRGVQNKYKKSEKGKISNDRWIKSERRKKNEYKYRQNPKAKKLAVLRVRKYYQKYPEKYKESLEKERLKRRWLNNKYCKLNRISSKKYRQTEKGKQTRRNGKALRRQVERIGRVTLGEWNNKLKEFGNKCAKCKKMSNLEQDHIIPLSKGGKHIISNIQPLCRSCNAGKSDKIES